MTGDFRRLTDLRMPPVQLEPDDTFLARLGAIAAASGAATPSTVHPHRNWKVALATASVAAIVTGSVGLASALQGEQEPAPATPPVTEPTDGPDSPTPDEAGDRTRPPSGTVGRDRRDDSGDGDRRGSAPQQGSGDGTDEGTEPGPDLPDSGADADDATDSGDEDGPGPDDDPGDHEPGDDEADDADDSEAGDGSDDDNGDSGDDGESDVPDPDDASDDDSDEPDPDDSAPPSDPDSGS